MSRVEEYREMVRCQESGTHKRQRETPCGACGHDELDFPVPQKVKLAPLGLIANVEEAITGLTGSTVRLPDSTDAGVVVSVEKDGDWLVATVLLNFSVELGLDRLSIGAKALPNPVAKVFEDFERMSGASHFADVPRLEALAQSEGLPVEFKDLRKAAADRAHVPTVQGGDFLSVRTALLVEGFIAGVRLERASSVVDAVTQAPVETPVLDILLGVSKPWLGLGWEACEGKPGECAGCPFVEGEREVNEHDPGEGYYQCGMLDMEVWGENPRCTREQWQQAALRELGRA